MKSTFPKPKSHLAQQAPHSSSSVLGCPHLKFFRRIFLLDLWLKLLIPLSALGACYQLPFLVSHHASCQLTLPLHGCTHSCLHGPLLVPFTLQIVTAPLLLMLMAFTGRHWPVPRLLLASLHLPTPVSGLLCFSLPPL